MTSESIRYAIGSRERLEPGFPQAVHVRNAVGDVLAVGPHSESGKLTYGFWPTARLLGDVHLDPGARRGCSATCTSTLVPSVSFTSSSGLKTPSSYLAAMVMTFALAILRIPGWPPGRARV